MGVNDSKESEMHDPRGLISLKLFLRNQAEELHVPEIRKLTEPLVTVTVPAIVVRTRTPSMSSLLTCVVKS